jgi:hypothetical protein
MGTKDRTKLQEKTVTILAAMAAQTIECAYFIRVYAEKKNFCMSVICAQVVALIISLTLGMRAVKHLVSDADHQIEEYKNKFADLQAAFNGHAILDVEISVLHILDDMEDLSESMWWLH